MVTMAMMGVFSTHRGQVNSMVQLSPPMMLWAAALTLLTAPSSLPRMVPD